MRVLRPNFEKRGGLITVVTQDVDTRRILMVAYTDEAGYLETLRTGKAVYFSTSRNERWMKGETSGNIQTIRQILIDCDGDAIIYLVDQIGLGSCHTGAATCFYRTFVENVQILHAPEAGIKEELLVIDVEVHIRSNGIVVR